MICVDERDKCIDCKYHRFCDKNLKNCIDNTSKCKLMELWGVNLDCGDCIKDGQCPLQWTVQ